MNLCKRDAHFGIALQEDKGQGFIEYTIMLALVALGAVGALSVLGSVTYVNLLKKVADAVTGAGP